MFCYEYPEFEKKRLLKIEMLEQLRDFPRHYAKLLFQGYGNGIVNGCELFWDENRLTIDSGMIYWNGMLYFMESPYTLECSPENRLRYLVIEFLKEAKEDGIIYGNTRIYLSEEEPCSDKMELCRFHLQAGSRLRSIYTDFRDHSTEFDTINIIHAPFADIGGKTINPKILMKFAEEMMEMELSDPYDLTFCMNVLASGGKVSKRLIVQYLRYKSRRHLESEENGDLYQELKKSLDNRKNQENGRMQKDEIEKRIMLI